MLEKPYFQGQLLHCRYVITCAGLHSDKVAAFSGCSSEPRIVPFRGEYLLLNQEKSNMVNGNIYPVSENKHIHQNKQANKAVL